MIVETIDISLRTTGETRILIIETIRPKDENQIVIIDKTHRAIGMIGMIKEDRTMIEIALHTEVIQATTAIALHTGEMTTVITTTVQTIVIAKIDGMIAILVTSRTDDTTHRMTSEVPPRTVGTITTTITLTHVVAKVHIRT